MTILSTPFNSARHCRWNTITSGLDCFCVQENAVGELNMGQNSSPQCTYSDSDLKPFRIIYTNKPLDLSKANGKFGKISTKSNLVEGYSNPTVVAAADTIEEILYDWMLILKAGLTVKEAISALCFDDKVKVGHQPQWLELFIEKVWKSLYANVQEQRSRKTLEVAQSGFKKNSPVRDKSTLGALPPLGSAYPMANLDLNATRAAPTTASGNVPLGNSPSKSQMDAIVSESTSHDTTTLTGTDEACLPLYDVYDVFILRLWDLWGWRDPQHTGLVLVALILGGVLYGGGYLCNSAATCLLLFVLSLPLTREQRWRLRASQKTLHEGTSHVLLSSARTSMPGDQKATEKPQSWVEACIARDANRMQLLANFFPSLKGPLVRDALKARPDSTSNSGAARGDIGPSQLQEMIQRIGVPSRNAATIERLLKGCFGKICLAYVLVQLVLVIFFPYCSIGLILDTLAAPLIGASMLITGLVRLRPIFFATLKTVRTRACDERRLTRLMEVAELVVSRVCASAEALRRPKASDSSLAPSQMTSKPSSVAAPSKEGDSATGQGHHPLSKPQPITAAGPITVAGTTLGSSAQKPLYCLPALTDKEIAIVEQLTNYGAPFSMVLLKPIREWNQESGWTVQWEREGLRCEERQLSAGGGEGSEKNVLSIRFTARIQNANVGTFQSVLLDDPDFLDSKDSFAYQYTPLLLQNCVVKRLGYNLMILLSRYRSAIHEVPPLELLRYFSPSVLLDPEQQEALRLRRPYAHSASSSTTTAAGGHTHSAVPSGGVSKEGKPLMAVVQCAIPCPQELHPTPPCQPPHCRGPTEMFSILGIEEADGSLTMGFCTSFNGVDVVSSEWLSVFRSVMGRKAFQLAELLKRGGPMPNQLAVYKNERYFQPLLKRQPLSQVEAPPTSSAERRSASMQNPMIGSAFLTADLKLSDVPPGTLIQRTLSAKNLSHSTSAVPRVFSMSGTPSRTPPTSASESSVSAAPAPWPRFVEHFVKHLLTSTPWRREGGSERVGLYTGPSPFPAAKAYCGVSFAAGATLGVVESVTHHNQFAPYRDDQAERQITVTPKNLEEVIANAAPPGTTEGAGEREKEKENGGKGRGSLPRPDFAWEAHYGLTVRLTQANHAAVGFPAIDVVTHVAEPYYCLAKDAFSTLLVSDQLVGEPLAALKQLSPETKMLFCCGEDASTVLPEMKDFRRCKVFLFGYLCWEGVSRESGERGVHIIHCVVTDIKKLIPSMSDSVMLQYHLQAMELQREQIMRMSKGGVSGSN